MKKNAKKLMVLALVLSAIVCTAAFAGGAKETKPASGATTAAPAAKVTITLWTGGSDNVKNAWQMLAKEFNTNSQYKNKYELKIEHIASGTGATTLLDRVLAAYKAKELKAGFDIIEVSSSEYSTYLREGGKDIFVTLDKAKIPNYKNMVAKMSGGQEHLVPYRGTTVVLAYNKAKVPNPPQTAEALYDWIKKNPGQFAYNTPGSGGSGASFVMTAVYNFLPTEALSSKDEKWMKEWDKGFDFLKTLHPYMYKSSGKVFYPHKNQGSLDLLANGQISMTPAWVDMILTQLKQGTLPETIEMTQIKPGFTGELANLAIPFCTTNVDGASAVLDFVLSTQAQTILLDGMAAFPVIDIASINSGASVNAKKMASFKLEDFRTQEIGLLTKELAKRWDQQIATIEK